MTLDWGNVPAWVEALATVATAIIAGVALRAWRSPLRGKSQHSTATDIREQARLLRYLFYDARTPLYEGWEFPSEYYEKDRGPRIEGAGSQVEARGWAHVFENRWKLLQPQILVLAKLRARAGAVLSDDVATAIEELARKARELHNYMGERVEQYRVGENIVQQWDQRWVERVNESVSADRPNPTDAYSREFEEKLRRLEDVITPYL